MINNLPLIDLSNTEVNVDIHKHHIKEDSKQVLDQNDQVIAMSNELGDMVMTSW